MSHKKSLSKESRVFENRSIPFHYFDSPFVFDIDSTQPALPLKR